MDIESSINNIHPNIKLGEEHLAIVKEIYKVFRKRQGDSILHYFKPDATWITHGNEEYVRTTGTFRGKEALDTHLTLLKTELDFEVVRIQEIIASHDGTKAIAYGEFRLALRNNVSYGSRFNRFVDIWAFDPESHLVQQVDVYITPYAIEFQAA